MRYCSHCGNPLTPGAAFCQHCGTALKAFAPEAETVAEPLQAAEVPVQEAAPIVPVAAPDCDQKAVQEEKEFLEQTHRLLRWERKAWSIAGKVMLIMGIAFAALFFLIGMIAAVAGEEVGLGIFVLLLWYAILIGGTLIVIGIVNIVNANKIPQYTDTMFKDFRAAHTRCNSIGMIVLCYFFNTIALVFFVINFARMKSNKELAQRILTRQGF